MIDSAETVEISYGTDLLQKVTTGNMSSGAFFKEWLTLLPQQIKEHAAHAENNHIMTVSFDRFSPVDVYVIKENILKHAKSL